jgi:hypothetical protein
MYIKKKRALSNMNLYQESRNLGAIARMNNAHRVPLHDKKLMALIGEKTIDIYQMHTCMKQWLNGWDEMNIEYAKPIIEEM